MRLEDVAVAISGVQGDALGVGVVVNQRIVLTCAHVVNVALGHDINNNVRPTGTVLVNRPGHSKVSAKVDAGEDAWIPPTAMLGDLCLLRLEQELRDPIKVARFKTYADPVGLQCRAMGFPPGWPIDFAEGSVSGRDGQLLVIRPDPTTLAVHSTQKSGLLLAPQRPPGIIHQSFSGSPVEVDGWIIGIIGQARKLPSEATALAIPVSLFPERIRKDSALYRNAVEERYPHVSRVYAYAQQKQSLYKPGRFDLRMRFCDLFSDVLNAHRTTRSPSRSQDGAPLEGGYADGVDLRPPELARVLATGPHPTKRVSPLLLHAPGGAGKSAFLYDFLRAASEDNLVPFVLDFSNDPKPLRENTGFFLKDWFRSYSGIGDVDTLTQLAQRREAGMIPLLVIDAFNQAEKNGAGILRDVVNLVNQELAGAILVVADRMTDRGAVMDQFRHAVIPPLSRSAFQLALRAKHLDAVAQDEGWHPVLSSPLFLDLLLRLPAAPRVLPSRFDVLNEYFRKVCNFEKDELLSLSTFAYEAYAKFGRTSIPRRHINFAEPTAKKVEIAGLLQDLDADSVEFRHQILHDCLAALKVASTTEADDKTLLSPPAFDALSLKSSSHDAIELATEALQTPDKLLALRSAPLSPRSFLTHVYDWNYWITLQCIASFDRRGQSPIPSWMRHAFYALNLEKRFDPFLHTAARAERLLELLPSNAGAEYVTPDARALLAKVRAIILGALEDSDLPHAEARYCRDWLDLYTRETPFSDDELRLLWADPFVSWTAANVLRRLPSRSDLTAQVMRHYESARATDGFTAKATAFRWRLVHVLGRGIATNSDLLVKVLFDSSEDNHVRYGAARSLLEFVVTQAGRSECERTIALLHSRLAELFEGNQVTLGSVRRELRRSCAFNEPCVSGREGWLSDWVEGGLNAFSALARDGQTMAEKAGLQEEARSWQLWTTSIQLAAAAESWPERRKALIHAITEDQ